MKIRRNHHCRDSRNAWRTYARFYAFGYEGRNRQPVDKGLLYPFFQSADYCACLSIADNRRYFYGGNMSDKKYTREDCITLLSDKYAELQSKGLTRYPQRSDFEPEEVVAIKAFLGPWPRALEAAGVKPHKTL